MAARLTLFIAVVYTIFITTLSLVQLGDLSVGHFSPTDKMLHAGAYFGLSFLWFFYYMLVRPESSYKIGFLKIVGVILLFGMLIEVLQGTLTDYRQPDWADILANTFGVLIAWIFYTVFMKFLSRVKHHITSFL